MIKHCKLQSPISSLLLLILFLSPQTTDAIEPEKDFGIIARVAANIIVKEHYRQHSLDDEISKALFEKYFQTLDPNKIYFTIQDIKKFEGYLDKLDNQVLEGDISFSFELYNIFLDKVEQYRQYAKKLLDQKMEFSGNETFLIDRSKSPWPASENEQKKLWNLKIKNDILSLRLMERAAKEENNKNGNALPQAWIKQPPEKRILKRISNYLHFLKENEPLDVLELYLTSLANIYDPHSEYMSPRTMEDFNIQMRLSLMGIGALLTSEEGYTKIVKIIPGGPADKDGRLQPEDRIIAVSQGDEEPVDVLDMPLTKVVSMIRGEKNTKVRLTILEGSKGVNSIPKVISLIRNTVELTDQEARGEICNIKNNDGTKSKKIGILYLPSFYFDFEGAYTGLQNFKSSTNDVKRILNEFSGAQIDGLVLDLRSNGGGSLIEAIRLTGLFIKKGPVVQVRSQDGNCQIQYDPDENSYYDGPMIVLINRLSASAAEIFAGAIQDYKRGIIAGDKHSHGKGTVQIVFNLDDILCHYGLKTPTGSVKITSAKFYRINGASTQNQGVSPDIVFPSFTDSMEIGEEYLDHALPWDNIAPVSHDDYFSGFTEILRRLGEKSFTRISVNHNFNVLKQNIETFNRIKEKKTITLNEEERWAFYQKEKNIIEQQSTLIKSDDGLEDEQKNGKEKQEDIYLNESINILLDFIELLSAKTIPESSEADK